MEKMRWKCGKSYYWMEFPGFEYSSLVGNSYFVPTYALKLFQRSYDELGVKVDAALYKEHKQLPPKIEFVVWQQYELTEFFYELLKNVTMRNYDDNTLSTFLNTKLEGYFRYGRVGRTSQRFEGVVLHSESGSPLFRWVGVRVSIDPQTRQPTPYADFVKEHFATSRDGDYIQMVRRHPDCCTRKISVPSGVAKYIFPSRCSASQIDVNNHLNQSCYVTICFDAVAEALHRGIFENMKPPIWKYNVSRVSLLYLKEAVLGDNLTTVVWQNEENKFVFHFHVMKGGDVACQAEVEFFSSQAKLPSKL